MTGQRIDQIAKLIETLPKFADGLTKAGSSRISLIGAIFLFAIAACAAHPAAP